MAIIPINLDEGIVEKIDLLVKQGLYKNRSEALRDQIVKGIENLSLISEPDKESDVYQKLLKELINSDPIPLLDGDKTINEMVSEGRER
ncbi:MAG: putative nickel-responsive regulator [Candidatus Heimdallarchaeota archaeon LC_3]|nr:MAG: putative nickel-responsive regulator [Candidatus Heimdallarchaeota archaeon LC_3]